ncbi:MAG: hypothetical protein JWN07_2621 [Hyphomicrobiales bacterium]|nr:hypothetical protein [Hyphomicrobiales bacterium]
MRRTTAAIAFVSLLAFAAPTLAQTEAAAPNTPAGAATSGASIKKAKPTRTAKSLACSKQADARKVHGAERRKFMSSCKKA